MSVDIRVTNADKVSKRLAEISLKLAEVNSNLSQALMKGGLMVERSAVENVSGPRPDKLDRVTGTLAASINTEERTSSSVAVGTNVEYARIHEFGGTIAHVGGGTTHMPARPYLRPALDDNRALVTNYIGGHVKNVIRGS